MCGFHNSNLFYPVYISTVYTILLPKHFFILCISPCFQTNMLYLTRAEVHFHAWVLHVVKVVWYLQHCMGSTTVLLYYTRILGFVPNAGTNQSEAISMFRILVSANLIHSIINELHTIRSVITDLVIIVRAEGKTTILILP